MIVPTATDQGSGCRDSGSIRAVSPSEGRHHGSPGRRHLRNGRRLRLAEDQVEFDNLAISGALGVQRHHFCGSRADRVRWVAVALSTVGFPPTEDASPSCCKSGPSIACQYCAQQSALNQIPKLHIPQLCPKCCSVVRFVKDEVASCPRGRNDPSRAGLGVP